MNHKAGKRELFAGVEWPAGQFLPPHHPAQVRNLGPPEMAVRLEDGICYLTSAIRALPIMTSGIPLVNSRTLFLTQSAAFSLEANASSRPGRHQADNSPGTPGFVASSARSLPARVWQGAPLNLVSRCIF